MRSLFLWRPATWQWLNDNSISHVWWLLARENVLTCVYVYKTGTDRRRPNAALAAAAQRARLLCVSHTPTALCSAAFIIQHVVRLQHRHAHVCNAITHARATSINNRACGVTDAAPPWMEWDCMGSVWGQRERARSFGAAAALCHRAYPQYPSCWRIYQRAAYRARAPCMFGGASSSSSSCVWVVFHSRVVRCVCGA